MPAGMTVPAETPNVGLAPLPTERLSTGPPVEAFGGGIAARGIDLSAVEQEVGQIHEQAKRNADQTAILAAAAKTSALVTKLGVRTKSLHGPASFTAPEDNKADWYSETGTTETGLTNDV